MNNDFRNIILTEERILMGMTSGVGINKAQVEILGIELVKGWKSKLIGKAIKESVYLKFLSLKGIKPNKNVLTKTMECKRWEFPC